MTLQCRYNPFSSIRERKVKSASRPSVAHRVRKEMKQAAQRNWLVLNPVSEKSYFYQNMVSFFFLHMRRNPLPAPVSAHVCVLLCGINENVKLKSCREGWVRSDTVRRRNGVRDFQMRKRRPRRLKKSGRHFERCDISFPKFKTRGPVKESWFREERRGSSNWTDDTQNVRWFKEMCVCSIAPQLQPTAGSRFRPRGTKLNPLCSLSCHCVIRRDSAVCVQGFRNHIWIRTRTETDVLIPRFP